MRQTEADRYEAHMSALAGKVWDREGGNLVLNPVDLRTPLSAVIAAESDPTRVSAEDLPHDRRDLAGLDWEELLAVALELQEERDLAAHRMLTTLLNFLFADGPNPLKVAERVFVLARTVSQNHVWNMQQNEAAAAFCLIKQTWQQMEKRMIEDLITRFSSTPFTTSGGKSHSARKRYSEQKKGNKIRAHGHKKGDR